MLETNLHSNHNHGTVNKGNEETTETLVIPLRQEDNFLSSVMYVENPDSENPTIYTVTNKQLEDFAKNENIDKSIRENVLMTFVYFDHETFGERRYSSIPEKLFESVPLKEGLDYKSFSVGSTETTTTGNKQVMVCIDTYHCVGCIGPCDGCSMCVSTSCTTIGTPGPGGPSTPGNPGGDGNSGGSGGDGTGIPNNIPWYLMNPDVDIYTYNGNVRNVFKKLTDFNIVLQKEQLDLLQQKSNITSYIYNYLSNNSLAKSQMVNWLLDYLWMKESYKNYYNTNASDLSFLTDLDIKDAEFNDSIADLMSDLMVSKQNNTLNNLEISWPNWDITKSKMKDRFKNNIPVAVKYGKVLFSNLKKITDKYPIMLTYTNKGIDKLRNEIHNEGLINYNINTMKWKDVVGCWLFELGNYPVNNTAGYGNIPTLGFAGTDYVISGVPNNAHQMRFLMTHKTLSNGSSSPNSVLALKKQAINKIKNGDYSSTSGNWGFGFDATIDTISQLDGLQFCLGSYLTTVYVTQVSTKTFELTFIVKNKTGWESGTRGLNNGDGNSTNDSVIPDKPRGEGLHLGGTIGETFGWKETITIP